LRVIIYDNGYCVIKNFGKFFPIYFESHEKKICERKKRQNLLERKHTGYVMIDALIHLDKQNERVCRCTELLLQIADQIAYQI
jgi:hypothetical protein